MKYFYTYVNIADFIGIITNVINMSVEQLWGLKITMQAYTTELINIKHVL